jgi:hypothetical protein
MAVNKLSNRQTLHDLTISKWIKMTLNAGDRVGIVTQTL